jgi:hypothetical protein
MIEGDDYGAISEMIEWQGKRKYSEGTYPDPVLSPTDPTWLEPRSNPGHFTGWSIPYSVMYLPS